MYGPGWGPSPGASSMAFTPVGHVATGSPNWEMLLDYTPMPTAAVGPPEESTPRGPAPGESPWIVCRGPSLVVMSMVPVPGLSYSH